MAEISVKAASPVLTITVDLDEARALKAALARDVEHRKQVGGARRIPLEEVYSAVSQAVTNAETILKGAGYIS